MAGFPTKLVESLSNGVPMLCNLTSDIGDYLIDMNNSIVVKDCTPQSIMEAVDRALKCDENKIKSLKIKARQTSEEFFDYRRYILSVKNILD